MNWRKKLRVATEPGEVFGRLTVIEELPARQHTPTGRVLRTIKCKCACGTITETPLQRLRSGNTKSCGCFHKEALKAANVRKTAKSAQIGMRFGRLLVESEKGVHISKGGSVKTVWNLLCDCGNKQIATTGSLTSGKIKSCGCLQSESAANNGRKSRNALINPDAGFIRVVGGYRNSAAKRGLVFELTDNEARRLFESDCHYCGDSPRNTADVSTYTLGPKKYLYNGIDRLDNGKGYTPQNTVSCCSVCNHAKHTMGHDEFVAWALRLANHQMLKERNK